GLSSETPSGHVDPLGVSCFLFGLFLDLDVLVVLRHGNLFVTGVDLREEPLPVLAHHAIGSAAAASTATATATARLVPPGLAPASGLNQGDEGLGGFLVRDRIERFVEVLDRLGVVVLGIPLDEGVDGDVGAL